MKWCFNGLAYYTTSTTQPLLTLQRTHRSALVRAVAVGGRPASDGILDPRDTLTCCCSALHRQQQYKQASKATSTHGVVISGATRRRITTSTSFSRWIDGTSSSNVHARNTKYREARHLLADQRIIKRTPDNKLQRSASEGPSSLRRLQTSISLKSFTDVLGPAHLQLCRSCRRFSLRHAELGCVVSAFKPLILIYGIIALMRPLHFQ